MLTPHPSSAIEYWFFKVNQGPIALIVDWIERRRLNEHLLRVSIHSPHKREVIFEKLDCLMPGDNFLSQKRTVGHAGDVSWDLNIELGAEMIKPDVVPAGLLKMPDILYESAPRASFTGWIRHGNQEVTLEQAYGAVTQYWGRQLAQEWWWLSAHQFDRQGVAVECSVFQTALWGTAMQMPFAFLYLHRNGKTDFLMAPPGSAKVIGSPDHFVIEFGGIGRKKIKLVGTGREYGDFGERIINTLIGDLKIFEGDQLIASAKGTAGLERRTPASRSKEK
jgi:hypothetical protein